jgi:hypothetical protein
MTSPNNAFVAGLLDRVSSILESQGGSHYRARAYRLAADVLRGLDRDVVELARAEGAAGLMHLPHVGKSIAAAITEIVDTGRLAMLERLQGDVGGEALFASLPGIGPKLAHRIHEALGVETLEALEIAAHDGRLEAVHGIGPRRARALREQLGSMLSRRGRGLARAAYAVPRVVPTVAALLDVDARYRAGASDGSLPKIAPRRFNPSGERWLPILHVEADGWHFTALFSNTALAHRLGQTHDWVVVFADGDGVEERFTVVTERVGPLAGRRVVRGREAECARHYGEHASAEAS